MEAFISSLVGLHWINLLPLIVGRQSGNTKLSVSSNRPGGSASTRNIFSASWGTSRRQLGIIATSAPRSHKRNCGPGNRSVADVYMMGMKDELLPR
jgi:hypothetical protein